MSAKLQLVTGRERGSKRTAPGTEDRYRYPATEQIWEVSCEPDRLPERDEKLADERRAS